MCRVCMCRVCTPRRWFRTPRRVCRTLTHHKNAAARASHAVALGECHVCCRRVPMPLSNSLRSHLLGRGRKCTIAPLSGPGERRETTVVKLCSPNMLRSDSCVFLIFTKRVDQTNRSTLVKLILFEKSRVELEFVFSIFTTRVRKHLGNSARFSPLRLPFELRDGSHRVGGIDPAEVCAGRRRPDHRPRQQGLDCPSSGCHR